MKLTNIASKKHTLRRKLFAYMCILASLLFILLMAGLFLIGNFTGTKQRLADTLEFQTQIFKREVDTYYDELAVMSVQLSYASANILEDYLRENGIAFDDLNNSEYHIESLQEELIDQLRHKLWEADCTGSFIMLDAQVNSHVPDAETSRTGIYLQRNSLDTTDTRVLLYRGLSSIGKAHDCMPHRKWRLEFSTNLFPDYEELRGCASFPLNKSYRITSVVLLPGTDQHVMLMTVPILSENGDFYGLCGFELNEGYFKQIFAQPSELEHAIFCISTDSRNVDLSSSTTLSAGVLNTYYLEPHGTFTSKPFGSGLTEYRAAGDGEASAGGGAGHSGSSASGSDDAHRNRNPEAYVGITEEIQLCPAECTSAISVLIPMSDYQRMLNVDRLRIVLLIMAFSIATIGLSLYFVRQYLQPLIKALDNIHKKEYAHEDIYSAEINDLFEFLAEQDRINEEQLNVLRREKADAMTAASQLKLKVDEATKQNQRLAYSRKDEIDPYDYENFKNGLTMLTEKEKEIFNFYMQGKTVKEIIATLGLQESTVRFHNRNIYAKLGVHSLKQLLRYAAVLHEEEMP